jgi:hypothetical protein
MTRPTPPPVLEPLKLFDDNYDDTNARYELSTIDAVRDAALIMYGRFVARINGQPTNDDEAKTKSQYLTLQETEQIVREHSCVVDGVYGIGGDTKEEAKNKINELLASLMDRVMSNVLQEGVKQELLDCQYDVDTNDFAFSVTEKGKQKVAEIRHERENCG